MTATVELSPMGFVIEDDFGPEGRRPVFGFKDEKVGTLVFHGRPWADEYTALRNAHSQTFNAEGYSEKEQELRQACKDLARSRGHVYT